MLADDIMGALSVLKAKPHLQGQKKCQLHKDTFMKKRRKRKNPAEICRNQNFTPASLRRKYRRLKEVTKRRRLDLMRKKKRNGHVNTQGVEGRQFVGSQTICPIAQLAQRCPGYGQVFPGGLYK